MEIYLKWQEGTGGKVLTSTIFSIHPHLETRVWDLEFSLTLARDFAHSVLL